MELKYLVLCGRILMARTRFRDPELSSPNRFADRGETVEDLSWDASAPCCLEDQITRRKGFSDSYHILLRVSPSMIPWIRAGSVGMVLRLMQLGQQCQQKH